jgi:hypothetical protein
MGSGTLQHLLASIDSTNSASIQEALDLLDAYQTAVGVPYV